MRTSNVGLALVTTYSALALFMVAQVARAGVIQTTSDQNVPSVSDPTSVMGGGNTPAPTQTIYTSTVGNTANTPGLSTGLTGNETVSNSSGNTNITYTPLEPIPGLENYESGNVNFGKLLDQLFKVVIILAAAVAVGAFVYAGIYYMVSDVPGIKLNAMKRLQAAFLGLMILLGSYIILYTINPQLVVFNGLSSGTSGLNSGKANNQTSNQSATPTVTDNGGSTVNVITAPGQEQIIQNARNNPNDAAAQAAASTVVQQRDAACTSGNSGELVLGTSPCNSGSNGTSQQYFGTKGVYNDCAVITTPSGANQVCYFNSSQ